MTQNDKQKFDPAQLTVLLCVICATGMIWYICNAQNIQQKHNDFKPMKNLSQYENALVYAAHDPILDARMARYDSLVHDYNDAFNAVLENYTGLFPIYHRFEKINVHPKYAKQIGANNLSQYSKYLDRFERDSVTPIYRNVYKKQVQPRIRNNTNSK